MDNDAQPTPPPAVPEPWRADPSTAGPWQPAQPQPGFTAGGYPIGAPGTYQPGGAPGPYQPSPYQPSPYQPSPYQPVGYTAGGYPIGGEQPVGPVGSMRYPQAAIAPAHPLLPEGRFVPTPPQKVNGYAITSFVLGLIGAVLFSVIFGIAALREPRKSNRSGAGFALAGLIVSLVWVVGVVAVIAVHVSSEPDRSASGAITTRGDVDPMTLQVGDCAEVPILGTGYVSSLPVMPCSEPHNGQVFTLVPLPGASFPGSSSLTSTGLALCRAAMPDFLGQSETRLHIVVFTPGDVSWSSNDRNARCLLVDRDHEITGDIRSDR